MTRRYRIVALAPAIWIAMASLSAAVTPQTVQWSVNGHFYRIVDDNVTWSQAKLLAEAQGGYLATMTSAAENLFVSTSFGSAVDQHWIGGLQPLGSPEPAGGWSWVTGEVFSYTNWNAGEPNNSGGTEDRIHFAGVNNGDGETWNDLNQDELKGYVIEWDANALPVPAAGWLGLATLGVLVAAVGAFVLRYRG